MRWKCHIDKGNFGPRVYEGKYKIQVKVDNFFIRQRKFEVEFRLDLKFMLFSEIKKILELN